jgi:hypothetical protein
MEAATVYLKYSNIPASVWKDLRNTMRNLNQNKSNYRSLTCDTMQFSRWISVFQKNLLPLSSQFYQNYTAAHPGRSNPTFHCCENFKSYLSEQYYPKGVPHKYNTIKTSCFFRKAATMPYDSFGKVSTASTESWISNSYQEVPPMTDFLYNDAYDKTPASQNITTSPNTHTDPCDERPKLSDECEYTSNKVTVHFHFKGHLFDLEMLNCPTCE